MINDLRKFTSDHVLLCACTLGLAIIGYLGYRAVMWIVDKCSKTQKIDDVARRTLVNADPVVSPAKIVPPLAKQLDQKWWLKITDSSEWKQFKSNWKEWSKDPESLRTETLKLTREYCQSTFRNKYHFDFQDPYYARGFIRYNDPPNPFELPADSTYNKPLGKIHLIPGEFGMWMPGMAIIASFLTEKKEIKGLSVCYTLEALTKQIKAIAENPADQRHAFITGVCEFVEGDIHPHFPQHKGAICVEKKDGKLTIAIIDPQATKETFDVDSHSQSLDVGDLILQAILKGCDKDHTPRLLYSQVAREKVYGCGIFALQDSIAYLRNPQFFDQITCKGAINIAGKQRVENITVLPPEHMLGTQTMQLLKDYERLTPTLYNRPLIGKRKKYKTLPEYLDAHSLDGTTRDGGLKKQNHYVTKKMMIYLKFVLMCTKEFTTEQMKEIINKTLVV